MIIKFLICLMVSIFDRRKRYIILNPNLSFLFIKKILIYDKKINKLFTQKIERYGDLITVFEIFYDNSYDVKKFKFWLKISPKIKKDKIPLIIDCGANIGCSTLFFSKNHPNSHIVAIEPEKKNFQLLKINTDNIKKKQVINTAVSSIPFKYNVRESLDSRAHTIVKSKNKNLKSKTITVNKIIEDFPSKKYNYFIIKIDIEGFEEELFKNNTEWLDKFKIIIIELHDWMEPFSNKSLNFQKTMFKSKKYKDIVISGENIILINY
tara:strand:- start:4563 stop:5357 length:795 start_codon:yes stop_codon:yes gene_type:complete